MANPERTGRLVAEKVVPIVEETAVVYKERVTTDTVRLHKRVHEDEQILDIPVQTEAIEVERVAVGRWIETPAVVRHEGDTTGPAADRPAPRGDRRRARGGSQGPRPSSRV